MKRSESLTPWRVIWRLIAAGAAFVLGWVVYMIAMMMTVYDGVLSMVFQPFMAVLFSGLFVGFALLVGQILRLPGLRWWRTNWIAAACVAGVSLFILIFGYSLGLRELVVNPETGVEFLTLDPTAALVSYFGLLFAVANWPTPGRKKASAATASDEVAAIDPLSQ